MSDYKAIKEVIDETNKLIKNINQITKVLPAVSPPRYLTNNEINDITSGIKYIPAANKDISVYNRKSIIKTEKTKLREIQIVPEEIPEFKRLYLMKFNLGSSEPGTAVGMTAAEAISAPVSQQTFDSFHQAGSSKNMIGGIDGFMETIQVTYRKNPYMVVYFKSRPTVDDILIKHTSTLLTVTVNDCVTDYKIEARNMLFPEGVLDTWYSTYEMIYPLSIPKSSYVMRLYLNLDVMFKHRVRVQQLINTLEEENIVKCFHSPIIKYPLGSDSGGPVDAWGIMLDIYVENINAITEDKEFKKSKVSDLEAPFFYFQNILINKLSSLKISGLNKIRDVEPIIKPIANSLYSEYPLIRFTKKESDKNFNLIKLNRVFMNYNGITIGDVIRLLNAAGVTNVQDIRKTNLSQEFDDLDLLVEVPLKPDDYPTDRKYDASHLVKFKIENDRKNIKDYRTAQKTLRSSKMAELNIASKEAKREIIIEANNIKIYKNPSLIYNESNLIYAETTGSDFGNLLKLDEVDITRSYTNNMYDIFHYFGIEAVRTYITRDLLLLIKLSDSYIDPRHAGLLSSWMTQFGIITPLTAKGLQKHNLGAIASASYRAPMISVKKDTLHSNIDYLKNTSGSIALGKMSRLGTGLPEILPDYSKIKRLLADKRKLEGKKLSGGTISDLIKLLEQGEPESTFDQTESNTTEIPVLQFTVETGVINIVEVTGISQPDYSNPLNLFPVISPELKLANENNVECESPSVPSIISIGTTRNEHQVESLPVIEVRIPEGLKEASSIEEKPPEVERIDTISSLDDLF